MKKLVSMRRIDNFFTHEIILSTWQYSICFEFRQFSFKNVYYNFFSLLDLVSLCLIILFVILTCFHPETVLFPFGGVNLHNYLSTY